MKIKRLSMLICFAIVAMMAFAMRYQIKVLNTSTVTINNQELKVGDWFDEQAVITWSKDNQAMRVLSEDNRVYTLSAKLYKDIKADKFSDFILYTKPLATRGNASLTLLEVLEQKFDNHFIMLDQIVIDLSDIEIPKKSSITLGNNAEKKVDFIITDSTTILKREMIKEIVFNETNTHSLKVYLQEGQNSPVLITDNMSIEILPLKLNEQNHIESVYTEIDSDNVSYPPLSFIDSLLSKAEVSYILKLQVLNTLNSGLDLFFN